MKKALVTGGSSGMGFAFAKLLLTQGYQVTILAHDEGQLKEAATSLKAKGLENVSYQAVDIRDPGAVNSALQNSGFEHLDIVIHAAGIMKLESVEDPREALRENLETDVEGAVNVILAVLPYLSEGSHLAVFDSVAAIVPIEGVTSYGSAKAALKMYCETLRPELAKKNISLTMIYPSIVRTPMPQSYKPDVLPDAIRFTKWHDPDKAVATFYKDIMKGHEESYLEFNERLLSVVARLAPKTFQKVFALWVRLKTPRKSA